MAYGAEHVFGSDLGPGFLLWVWFEVTNVVVGCTTIADNVMDSSGTGFDWAGWEVVGFIMDSLSHASIFCW